VIPLHSSGASGSATYLEPAEDAHTTAAAGRRQRPIGAVGADDDVGLAGEEALHEVVAAQRDDVDAVGRQPRELVLERQPRRPEPTTDVRWNTVAVARLSGSDDDEGDITERAHAPREREAATDGDSVVDPRHLNGAPELLIVQRDGGEALFRNRVAALTVDQRHVLREALVGQAA
jgi:hypothetical protein